MMAALALQKRKLKLAAIDFTEIPPPTFGSARDEWELFIRDLLELLGFRIEVDPDRGTDGGRDIVAIEVRNGIAGTTEIRWLVSCKHNAHSGDSVKPSDEPDIYDRVKTHGCNGFLGAYSTLPSSGLAGKLNAPNLEFETLAYDRARIEGFLLSSPKGVELARRYFPNSIRQWEVENPEPARLFRDSVELKCEACGNDLLSQGSTGLLQVVRPLTSPESGCNESISRIIPACKGDCDARLSAQARAHGNYTLWIDINDLKIPTLFIKQVSSTIRNTNEFEASALEEMINALINIFPFVSRHLTTAERERISSLSGIPESLGGLGSDDDC